MNDPEQQARIFKVLSVGTRVRMLELLKRSPRCVNALARALEITPAAVSQHLRILRDADLVTADRRGAFVHYAVNEKTLEKWNEVAGRLLKPQPRGRNR
jgi:DNA-binding transcriptional ArsR family regulator